MSSTSAGTKPLTTQQVAAFWEQGYLLIKGVLSAAEAARYRDVIMDLMPRDLSIPAHWRADAGRIKPTRPPAQRVPGTSPDMFDQPELLPLLFHEPLYAAAVQLLGTPKLRTGDGSLGITLRNTSGHEPLSQPLHLDATIPADRDTFGFTIEETQVGGCYYLTDVAPGGGGIHVVPGGPALVEERARAHPRGRSLYQHWKRIDDADGPNWPPTVEVTGAAGDFVMVHHLMPHAASHNRLPQPRVVQFTRFVRHDHPYGAAAPPPPGRFNQRQLQVMTPLGRRLLGVEPW